MQTQEIVDQLQSDWPTALKVASKIRKNADARGLRVVFGITHDVDQRRLHYEDELGAMILLYETIQLHQLPLIERELHASFRHCDGVELENERVFGFGMRSYDTAYYVYAAVEWRAPMRLDYLLPPSRSQLCRSR